MEFRKMVTITLYTRQQKRHWCIEQSFGLCGRGWGWDDLGKWHWNMYNIIYEMSRQSRFDAWYWMLGAWEVGGCRDSLSAQWRPWAKLIPSYCSAKPQCINDVSPPGHKIAAPDPAITYSHRKTQQELQAVLILAFYREENLISRPPIRPILSVLGQNESCGHTSKHVSWGNFLHFLIS